MSTVQNTQVTATGTGYRMAGSVNKQTARAAACAQQNYKQTAAQVEQPNTELWGWDNEAGTERTA